VTLLCSKPKFGKSWLAYDLCIGCTMNRMILGDILPAQGDVLYLALEDSKRRLQRRMSKLLPAGIPWPRHLTLKTEWRRLHEGGLDDIRAWHAHSKSNGHAGLIQANAPRAPTAAKKESGYAWLMQHQPCESPRLKNGASCRLPISFGRIARETHIVPCKRLDAVATKFVAHAGRHSPMSVHQCAAPSPCDLAVSLPRPSPRRLLLHRLTSGFRRSHRTF